MEILNVGVVGSRGFNDKDFVMKTLQQLTNRFGSLQSIRIVSGGAKGVDSWSEEFSNQFLNTQPLIFIPKWKDDFGRKDLSAGHKRNSDIVKNSDIVYAFWDGVSSGTKNSIAKCIKWHIPIKVFIKTDKELIELKSHYQIEEYFKNKGISLKFNV